MGNVLRYVVDVSFSKDIRNFANRNVARIRRYENRQIHRVERRMAKAALQKGREINSPRILTAR